MDVALMSVFSFLSDLDFVGVCIYSSCRRIFKRCLGF